MKKGTLSKLIHRHSHACSTNSKKRERVRYRARKQAGVFCATTTLSLSLFLSSVSSSSSSCFSSSVRPSVRPSVNPPSWVSLYSYMYSSSKSSYSIYKLRAEISVYRSRSNSSQLFSSALPRRKKTSWSGGRIKQRKRRKRKFPHSSSFIYSVVG